MARDLDLEDCYTEVWNQYVSVLKHSGIILSENGDMLVWSWNPASGILPTKLVYDLMFSSRVVDGSRWWINYLWKRNFPLQNKMFFLVSFTQ